MSEIQNSQANQKLSDWSTYDATRTEQIAADLVNTNPEMGQTEADGEARKIRTTEVFKNMDGDGSGTISNQEFRDYAANKLGLNEEQADRLFKSIDTNNDGSLGWKEVNGSASPESMGLQNAVLELKANLEAMSIMNNGNFFDQLKT